MTVRTRWAPSPTGYAHLGFISRILINYALAHKNSGQFVWRNEDTDMERFVPDALEFNMRWTREFGLDWDEGPDDEELPENLRKGGPYSPYTQSKRAAMGIYKEAYEKLIANGYAYRCFCTKERLAELRKMQELAKIQTRYDGHCRNLTQTEIDEKLASGENFTVRIKVPKDRKIEFDDLVTHNHIVWDSNEVDDAIIVKSNGVPTYHLAAMYDDILMKITHTMRGSEWLPSTPIHMLVFEGLGVKPEDRPQIGHFTVILDPTNPGKKMSKRNSSFRVNGLLIKGYLPEAILNYLMLLGWAPKDNREMFTLQEFVAAFDLGGMQKSNPTWNQQKMDWFNGVYIRQLDHEKLWEKINYWLNNYLIDKDRDEVFGDDPEAAKYLEFVEKVKASPELFRQGLPLVQERAVSFWEMLKQLYFLYVAPTNINWDIKQLSKVQDKILAAKSDIIDLFKSLADDVNSWTHEQWETSMRAIADKYEIKHGDVFMILRVAVVGTPFSPPLFEVLQILGKEEILRRLQNS